MSGVRYRLATLTLRAGKNDENHVSKNVLSEGEAAEQLKAEALMHLMAGWTVSIRSNGTVVCKKYRVRREIRVIGLTPMSDVSFASVSE